MAQEVSAGDWMGSADQAAVYLSNVWNSNFNKGKQQANKLVAVVAHLTESV